jgi:hypothetical protein
VNGIDQRRIRLVWSSDAARPWFSTHPVFTVIAVAVCGIVLLGWPSLQSQQEEIDGWIEGHRNLIGVMCLCAIAAIAGVVRRFSERHERVQDFPAFRLSRVPGADSHSAGGSPPAA